MSEKIGISNPAIGKNLKTLKEKNMIKRKGGTKGVWVIKSGK